MALNSSCENFAEKSVLFLEWLEKQPGTVINPCIEIADLRGHCAGRGIVATRDIKEDDELFSISHSTLLTVRNSGLPQIKPDVLDRLDTWNALILTLIYEDGLGSASKWWPYLSILPSDFDTLIYWSTSELQELQGSCVLNKIGRQDADKAFSTCLLPIVQQHSELFGQHAEAFAGAEAEKTLLQLAHRMATLIMAYGFDLENDTASSDDEDDDDDDEGNGSSQSAYELNKGMIPLADLFNANGDSNNAHLLQLENSMTMIALKDIHKGQQIFNDFGQLPRSDLLRRYGYVSDNYSKWDIVEVDIETVVQAAGDENKLDSREKADRLELAAAWDVLQDGYDLDRPVKNKTFKFDRALMLTISALLLNATDFTNALEDPPEQPPQRVQTSLNSVLQKIVSVRQSAYKTTITEDIALLDNPSVQGRHRMAISVRLGEKEILAMAAEEVERRIARLEQAFPGDPKTNQIKRRKV